MNPNKHEEKQAAKQEAIAKEIREFAVDLFNFIWAKQMFFSSDVNRQFAEDFSSTLMGADSLKSRCFNDNIGQAVLVSQILLREYFNQVQNFFGCVVPWTSFKSDVKYIFLNWIKNRTNIFVKVIDLGGIIGESFLYLDYFKRPFELCDAKVWFIEWFNEYLSTEFFRQGGWKQLSLLSSDCYSSFYEYFTSGFNPRARLQYCRLFYDIHLQELLKLSNVMYPVPKFAVVPFLKTDEDKLLRNIIFVRPATEVSRDFEKYIFDINAEIRTEFHSNSTNKCEFININFEENLPVSTNSGDSTFSRTDSKLEPTVKHEETNTSKLCEQNLEFRHTSTGSDNILNTEDQFSSETENLKNCETIKKATCLSEKTVPDKSSVNIVHDSLTKNSQNEMDSDKDLVKSDAWKNYVSFDWTIEVEEWERIQLLKDENYINLNKITNESNCETFSENNSSLQIPSEKVERTSEFLKQPNDVMLSSDCSYIASLENISLSENLEKFSNQINPTETSDVIGFKNKDETTENLFDKNYTYFDWTIEVEEWEKMQLLDNKDDLLNINESSPETRSKNIPGFHSPSHNIERNFSETTHKYISASSEDISDDLYVIGSDIPTISEEAISIQIDTKNSSDGTQTSSFDTQASFGTQVSSVGTQASSVGTQAPSVGTQDPSVGTQDPSVGTQAASVGTQAPPDRVIYENDLSKAHGNSTDVSYKDICKIESGSISSELELNKTVYSDDECLRCEKLENVDETDEMKKILHKGELDETLTKTVETQLFKNLKDRSVYVEPPICTVPLLEMSTYKEFEEKVHEEILRYLRITAPRSQTIFHLVSPKCSNSFEKLYEFHYDNGKLRNKYTSENYEITEKTSTRGVKLIKTLKKFEENIHLVTNVFQFYFFGKLPKHLKIKLELQKTENVDANFTKKKRKQKRK